METIIFLRHGQAEDDDGSGDAARPLTGKGVRQAEVAGRALRSLGLIPDLCLSSPRTRAIETARGACKTLGLEPVIDEGLGVGEFDAKGLAAGQGCVLLVGHEPSFSAEVARLTGGSVRVRKGGIAVVRGSGLEMLAGGKQPPAVARNERRDAGLILAIPTANLGVFGHMRLNEKECAHGAILD